MDRSDVSDPGAPESHDGSRRRPRRAAPGLQQLPWRRLTNPFRPVEILSADQVETILLADAVPPPLDPPVLEALDAFVARRKREIAGGA